MRVLAPVVLMLALTVGCGVSSYSSECSGGTCEVSVDGARDFEFGDEEGEVTAIGDGTVELRLVGRTDSVRVGEPARFGPYEVTVSSASDGEAEFTITQPG